MDKKACSVGAGFLNAKDEKRAFLVPLWFRFLEEVDKMNAQHKFGGYHVSILKMDMKHWLQILRPRTCWALGEPLKALTCQPFFH